ncbi:transposase [Aneurinibacillus sp. BA2021]|nr:transposase [Aneurinibacillus sp. BA2021]
MMLKVILFAYSQKVYSSRCIEKLIRRMASLNLAIIYKWPRKINLSCSTPFINARQKIEVESVFGHIKGNRSFRRFFLRRLDKVHVEFGIVTLAHNLLKVARSHLSALLNLNKFKKEDGEKLFVFRHLLYCCRDFLDSPFCA